jgi:hypothetical protein
MTVRELIEHLETLDQDKNIWVFYDYPCAAFEPIPDDTAEEDAEIFFKEKGVKKGDYVITAG